MIWEASADEADAERGSGLPQTDVVLAPENTAIGTATYVRTEKYLQESALVNTVAVEKNVQPAGEVSEPA